MTILSRPLILPLLFEPSFFSSITLLPLTSTDHHFVLCLSHVGGLLLQGSIFALRCIRDVFLSSSFTVATVSLRNSPYSFSDLQTLLLNTWTCRTQISRVVQSCVQSCCTLEEVSIQLSTSLAQSRLLSPLRVSSGLARNNCTARKILNYWPSNPHFVCNC